MRARFEAFGLQGPCTDTAQQGGRGVEGATGTCLPRQQTDVVPADLLLGLQYAGEKEAWEYFDQFITGFVEFGRLTDREIEAIPDLINLRILSSECCPHASLRSADGYGSRDLALCVCGSDVIYFVGRALAKEDDISR